MGKFDRLKIWYSDEGLIAFPKALLVVLIYYTPLYTLSESVLGVQMHEKLIRSPRLGYWPNIKNPRTFNEKILHRKLYTDEKIYTTVADKWEVRNFVEKRVGDSVLNEVYHVTDDPKTIPFDELPEKFVIKANNGCGSNILVMDKDTINRGKIRSQCKHWLDSSHGHRQREYWYSRIQPKIMVERYIETEDQEVPRDYKFFVFNGEVKYIQVDFDRFRDHTRTFFDPEWNKLDMRNEYPMGPVMEKPAKLAEMIQVAEALGDGFGHLRVDLYNPDDDTVIFGELTLAHESGIGRFDPVHYDYEFGNHWASGY